MLRILPSTIALVTIGTLAGPAQAQCYTLVRHEQLLGRYVPVGDHCAEDPIEARRRCRAEARRRNRDLPSSEPLRFLCRAAE
jgi:hypothetical protein